MAPITESEWLAHTQSPEMLGLLRDRACEKDLSRFAVACCRRIWPHLHDERSRRAVEMAERDCACAAAIHRVHPIRPKAQKHAQLAVETEAEYAEQCHLLRGIFGYPFAP